jgi:hypothetical protein
MEAGVGDERSGVATEIPPGVDAKMVGNDELNVGAAREQDRSEVVGQRCIGVSDEGLSVVGLESVPPLAMTGLVDRVTHSPTG